MKRTHPPSQTSPSIENKKSFKDKARQAAQERLNESDYLAWKLNKNVPQFSHSLTLHSSQYKKVVQLYKEITDKKSDGKKGQDYITDLSILCANLLNRRGKPISISMSTNSWVKSRYRRAGQFTREAIPLLEEQGLIEWERQMV